jgi:hypothetical protein
MRCANCGSDVRRGVKFCGQCGASLTGKAAEPAPRAAGPDPHAGRPSAASETPPLWRPDWRWHLRTLGVIYAALVAVYFALSLFLSRVPEPYRMRDVPPEMTPWLKK